MVDVVVGTRRRPALRDPKRADGYGRWLELREGDDFLGVQNYERVPFDPEGLVRPPEGAG